MTLPTIFSDCKKYRYILARQWNTDLPMLLFIGLNPSIADAEYNDPTIKRCIDFATQWGYGGFYMLNLFALIETDSNRLHKHDEPTLVGAQNDQYLQEYAQKTDKVVAVWGNKGNLYHRDKAVKALFPKLYAIELSKNGNPKHPLYLRKTAQLQEYV